MLLQGARENLFRPAPAIVNEVLLDERIDENPCPSLPKPENMARAANRLRQQLRPEDPTDLAFEISEENIPADFLVAKLPGGEMTGYLYTVCEDYTKTSNHCMINKSPFAMLPGNHFKKMLG